MSSTFSSGASSPISRVSLIVAAWTTQLITTHHDQVSFLGIPAAISTRANRAGRDEGRKLGL